MKVPDWFPGTGWKRIAQKWREVKEAAINEPYAWTKKQVVRLGGSVLSVVFNRVKRFMIIPRLREFLNPQCSALYSRIIHLFQNLRPRKEITA